ncbi:MAG: transcriptional regulator [Peptococcaceae bacterium BRH_c4a]|nr:MAG: transcriptional regulator [Peptococcaceae bacterium BRH_c4a]
MPKSQSEKGKVLRLSIIFDMLNRKSPYGGVTIAELKEKCGVGERQIYRYFDYIENELKVGLVRPEKNSSKREGLYRLDAGYLPSISPQKATIIFLSLLQQKGSALTGSLNDIKDTLVSTLFKYKYSPDTLQLEKIQDRIHLVEDDLANPGDVGNNFAKLIDAIKDSCRVKIWYFVSHSCQETERVVEPYGLICKRQNWYLLGKCMKRNDIRVFRVDQISCVFPYLTEKFIYPREFSLKDYMANSWGVFNDGEVRQVRVRFNKSVAHRVKNIIYHPSQQIKELPDGSVVVSFEICGLAEFRTWVIQWGDTAEVLEPQSLREEIRAMAASIAGLYDKQNSTSDNDKI